MRVIICGDRNWDDRKSIENYILSLPIGSVIIQGKCRGADEIARYYAFLYGYEYIDFPADWERYGKAAGPIRNRQMLDEGIPDIVVAFHNDISKSKGTANMLKQAEERGIPTELRSSIRKVRK